MELREAAAQHGAVNAVLGGMNARHYLSGGLAALPENSNGVPFNMSHVYASGNTAADMYANVAAEATGRVLAVRLHNMTDDAGMKDTLQFLIARDTMHQNQWLAVIEELGGHQGALPIPNSHPQSAEHRRFSHAFIDPRVGSDATPIEGRFTHGRSLDGKGEFTIENAAPLGDVPQLAAPVALVRHVPQARPTRRGAPPRRARASPFAAPGRHVNRALSATIVSGPAVRGAARANHSTRGGRAVDRRAVELYLCRAAAAESVRELHAIAQAARLAHPDDADTELVERVCWAAVPRLFTADRPERSRYAAARPAARPAGDGREHRPRFDWKARAAGM